ncbi:MAG: hypothetical protein ACOYYJ_17255 [Chloroflexota bacterium]
MEPVVTIPIGFLRLVQRMREAQNQIYPDGNRAARDRAAALEIEVDAEIAAFYAVMESMGLFMPSHREE